MRTPSARTIIIVLSVCLLFSLCLNLFAGGAWFAARWLDRRLEASAGRVMQAYPLALRQEVVRKLREDRREFIAAVRDLRAARLVMFAAMRADPFDRMALARAMLDVRAKTDAVQALLQGTLAASLETMPAEVRAQIVPPGLGLGLFDENRP